MNLTVKTKKEKNLAIVAASGEIDAVTCTRLEEELGGLIEKGETRIILDLKEVRYISSAGLRVILSSTQKLDGKGKLVLARLTEDVFEIIEMTGFTHIMDIFDDLDKARQSLSGI